MSLIKRNLVIKITNTQLAFTCSKSTIKTRIYYQPLTHPTTCSSVSIAKPEHAIADFVFTVKTNIAKLSKYSKP